MEPHKLRHLGKAPSSGWDVYSMALSNPENFPDSLPVSSSKFVRLLSWNAAKVSSKAMGEVAEHFLKP